MKLAELEALDNVLLDELSAKTFFFGLNPAPLPTTYIDQAMWIQNELEKRGFHMRLCSPFRPGEKWFAGFTKHGVTGFNGKPDFEAGATTPMRAIVIAGLLAHLSQ